MMKYYCAYFSPTGGTKKIARLLSSALPGAEELDFTVQSPVLQAGKEDICLVAVPSFGGRVPSIAVERIRTWKGNGARVIAVVAYGNRDIDDTLLELCNELKSVGFEVAAAVSAVAEHSIMRQFAAGRPDAKDEAQLMEFGIQIQSKLASGETGVTVPGKEPYKEFKGVPMKPEAGKGCTACGLCTNECPAGAIDPRNPKGVDKSRCISCMRCVSICPAQARKVNPALLAAASLGMKKVCSVRKENHLYL